MRHTIILFTVLLLAACNSGERQRLQLEELERMNRADSVMLNDSLARDLAEWFDRHGSRNEQLRAYYMLGRTYADRGETPQALEAYNDAVDRADTASADCNYYTLCRVYSQMADIFYKQNLLNEDLRCLDQSIRYAYLAGDTTAAMNSYGQKTDAFELLDKPDSVIANCQKTISYPEIFYDYIAMASNAYIVKEDLTNARKCLEIYERNSGYFDNFGNIESGREAYYNIKGDLYYHAEQFDSAEYFFRRVLQEGRGYTFQNIAARSLSLLYQKIGNADSAAKYAIYSYEMNDSDYAQMSTETFARMQAMYDYSHHQQVAQQEKERADRERMHFWSLVFYVIGSIIALSILAAIVFAALLHQRKKALKHYYIKVEELKAAQQELRQLLQRSSESEMLISKKEQEIRRLQSELDITMKNRQLKRDKEKFQMEESGIGQLLRRKAASGTKLTEEEWARINLFISESMPEFDAFLSSKAEILGIQWMRICILFRLFVIEKNVGTMLGVSAPFISSECKKINSKLFFVEGSGKVLARELLKI